MKGCPRASDLVLLARRLAKLPLIDAAYCRGEVDPTKVREIARVATAETEDAWLRLAKTGTSRQLEEAVSRARRGDLPGEGLRA